MFGVFRITTQTFELKPKNLKQSIILVAAKLGHLSMLQITILEALRTKNKRFSSHYPIILETISWDGYIPRVVLELSSISIFGWTHNLYMTNS